MGFRDCECKLALDYAYEGGQKLLRYENIYNSCQINLFINELKYNLQNFESNITGDGNVPVMQSEYRDMQMQNTLQKLRGMNIS